ncbi:hypothetical protein MICAH_810001 [Microcystis aeruginosa PCC 9809]|jgi:hypothetical protein|uniref:DUF5615 domain-containing protein n=1 Tax=Microcystis aeruginosa PCC 9809 TaxID=1160285 RepID=I4I773_MICAE|nr:hypothetical protein MICAH_810001 [Microcystis aeruginosa PCC 9809]
MKLLLDENLSDRIIDKIIDLYADSQHVKTLGLINTDDALIWEFAKFNDFVIVSKGLFWFLCGNEAYTDSFFGKIVVKVFLRQHFTIP